MGFRRADGRVGTRNFILIVPTSMCASHESQQISTIAEFSLYNREKFPNVDGIVAIPHNKGAGVPTDPISTSCSVCFPTTPIIRMSVAWFSWNWVARKRIYPSSKTT
jgi:hypothetical protein